MALHKASSTLQAPQQRGFHRACQAWSHPKGCSSRRSRHLSPPTLFGRMWMPMNSQPRSQSSRRTTCPRHNCSRTSLRRHRMRNLSWHCCKTKSVGSCPACSTPSRQGVCRRTLMRTCPRMMVCRADWSHPYPELDCFARVPQQSLPVPVTPPLCKCAASPFSSATIATASRPRNTRGTRRIRLNRFAKHLA
jgi:hypothetical protein